MNGAWQFQDEPCVCVECGIYPAAEDPPVEKQIEVVQKEPLVMPSDTKIETKKEESGFLGKLVEAAKDEGSEAVWRTGASTFAESAKAPILGMLKRQGVNVTPINAALLLPIGAAAYEFGLGCVVPHIPGLMTLEIRTRVGRELRIGAMHSVGKQLSSVLVGPLNEALEKAFAGELASK